MIDKSGFIPFTKNRSRVNNAAVILGLGAAAIAGTECARNFQATAQANPLANATEPVSPQLQANYDTINFIGPNSLLDSQQFSEAHIHDDAKDLAAPTITLAGKPEVVWAAGMGQCNPDDIPDQEPRAYQANGQVTLIASHYDTYPLAGPSLDQVTKNSCTPVWTSSNNPNFSDQNYQEWTTAPFLTQDANGAQVIVSVNHSEWHGMLENQMADATPMFRLLNPTTGEHFYPVNPAERDTVMKAGFVSEGICCNVLKSQEPGSVPLYRLSSTTGPSHVLTANESEKNNLVASGQFILEGVTGYCNTSQQDGNGPLYGLHNAVNGQRFYTMNLDEANAAAKAGLVMDGPVCYMPTGTIASSPVACTSANETSGWVNSLDLVISYDGGKTFTQSKDNYKIFTPPEAWDNSRMNCDPNHPTIYGTFEPTNIIQGKDGYYYAFYKTEADPDQTMQKGVCLMRTDNLLDASSWRVYQKYSDGSEGWIVSPHGACRPMDNVNALHTAYSITYMTEFDEYMLMGYEDGDANNPAGVYALFSKDFRNWSHPSLIQAGDKMTYPVALDTASQDPNFTTISFRGTSYIYFVYINPNDNNDRQVMRQKIEINVGK